MLWATTTSFVAVCQVFWRLVLWFPSWATARLHAVVLDFLEVQLQEYVPEVPPPPAPVTPLDRNVEWFQVQSQRMVDLLWNLHLGWGILVAMIVMAFAYVAVRTPVKRVAWKLRGIQGESLREGSEFLPMSIPSCQVAIMVPGLLTDSHIGYGIRRQSYLITPQHVLEDKTTILLSSPKCKVVVPVHKIKSRLMSDLAYVFVSDKAWSMLGVTSASFPTKHRNHFASCVGMLGGSSGFLRKSSIKGMLTYNGSTIPGMSGAAYDMGGAVYGIHTGAAGNHNVGVSYQVLAAEMRHFIVVEDSEVSKDSSAARFINTELDERVKEWESELLDEQAHDRWSKDEWFNLEEDEDFYNQDLGYEAYKRAVRKVAGRNKKTGTRSRVTFDLDENQVHVSNEAAAEKGVPSYERFKLDYKGHSGDGKDCTFDLVSMNLVKQVADHERRLAILEQPKAPRIPTPPKERVVVPCDQCKVTCNSEVKMANHKVSSHPDRFVCACGKKMMADKADQHQLTCVLRVQPESAVPEDTGARSRVVKQDSFLARRPNSNSPKRNKKTYRESLSSSSGPTRSRQGEDDLKEVKESLNSLCQLLKRALPDMVGQASAIVPK